MSTDDLKRLRQDTDKAIRSVERRRRAVTDLWFQGEAINWGDLSCREAALVLTDEGQSYIRVSIEEAAPDVTAFQAAIRKELAIIGWPNVIVETAW